MMNNCGFLFYGPSGCGKSLFSRAFAGEIGGVCVSLEHSEILENPITNIRGALAGVEQYGVRVVIVDDIDTLIRALREFSAAHNFLMKWIKRPPGSVSVISTTRNPHCLQNDELHAFKHILPILYPTTAERYDILGVLAKGRKVEDSALLKEAAQSTKWWSGEELAELIEHLELVKKSSPTRDQVLETIHTIQLGISIEKRKQEIEKFLEFTSSHCSSDFFKEVSRRDYSPLVSCTKTEHTNMSNSLVIEKLVLGDQYNIEQAGVVGPNGTACHLSLTHSSDRGKNSL